MTNGPRPRPASTTLAELLREFELTKETVLRLALSSDEASEADSETNDDAPGGAGRPAEGQLVEFLTDMRRSLLTHPTAARAIVGFLVAEGRRYAETPEGQRTYSAMTRSPDVETLRTIWEKVTLNLLDDEDDDGPVPEAWVELIRDLAVGSGLDRLATQLRPDGLA